MTGEDGSKALDLVMAYCGSCEVLQTDGGKEFMGGFGQRVGCYAHRHRLARPYRQNEQAFVESFHRTLRIECLGWWKYKLSEKDALQQEVQEYLDYYHYQRPHLGLGMQPPLPPPCRI